MLGRTLLLAAMAASAAPAYAFPLQEKAAYIANYGDLVKRPMLAVDFDGDGKRELALVANEQSPQLVVLAEHAGSWASLQVVDLNALRTASELMLWNTPTGAAVAAMVPPPSWMLGNTQLIIFEGWPLRETRRFDLQSDALAGVIADVDSDGVAELVASSYSGSMVYDLGRGTLKWSSPVGGSDIIANQLDADPALEIVVAGSVIDGATHALEWSYPDGFGQYLAAGRLADAGSTQFVGVSSQLTVFRGAPWSPLWDMTVSDVDAIAVGDLDGAGLDEIIHAESQFGDINIIDSSTRSIRYSIENPGDGVGGLTVADITGDSRAEIVFAPISSQRGVAMRFARGSDGATLFDLETSEGMTRAVALGDIDADGRLDVVTANDGRPGRVHIRDFETGNIEWSSPALIGNANEPFYIAADVLKLAQLDADPALEVVLAGTSSYSGRIIVIDGASHAVQLQIGDYSNSRPMDNRGIQGAELLDFDGNGQLDLVVATQPSNSGAAGSKLHVFSLTTGQSLWESVAMNANVAGSPGVLVIPANGSTAAQLVAVLTSGLRAYDASDQLLTWTLQAEITAAALIGDAAGAPELVLASPDGTIRHFDANTRALRGSYSVTGPVSAIQPVPGGQQLLMLANGQLILVGANGQLLDASGPFRPTLDSASLALSATTRGFDLLAGTSFGHRQYGLLPHAIFIDGFD